MDKNIKEDFKKISGGYDDEDSGGGEHDSSGGLRWLLTYSDMITLLLVFFIIMFTISETNSKKFGLFLKSVSKGLNVKEEEVIPAVIPAISEEDAATREEQDALRKLIKELKLTFSKEIGYGFISIERGKRGITLRIENTTLFEKGNANIKTEAKDILKKVAEDLKVIPNQIAIEGHTDSIPINTAEFPSNWELSTKRAVNVLRYLVEDEGFAPYRIAASGYGEYRPLVPNDPVLGAAPNRRVEITILDYNPE
ncbi:MAG: OmpA family protein [Nitrospinae bacterium]|nr:OmpA family protein [Nitrospinota bacterium]